MDVSKAVQRSIYMCDIDSASFVSFQYSILETQTHHVGRTRDGKNIKCEKRQCIAVGTVRMFIEPSAKHKCQ